MEGRKRPDGGNKKNKKTCKDVGECEDANRIIWGTMRIKGAVKTHKTKREDLAK